MVRNAKSYGVFLAAVGGLFCLGSIARADVIYQDNFSGGSSGTTLASDSSSLVATGLDGGSVTTWTVTAGSTDATWLYSGSDSVTISSPNGDGGRDTGLITNAYLPFTPQAGYIYTLQSTFQVAAAGTDNHWCGLSFISTLNGGNGGAEALSNDEPTGLVIVRDGNGTTTTYGPGQTADQIDVFEAASGGTGGDTAFNIPGGIGATVTISEVLNTMGASDTLTWYINGTNVGATTTLSGNPAINYVAFGDDTAPSGVVSAFSLTAVPEPGTLSLLGLSGLLAFKRRRKRA
jgi:hypothetical protein